MEQKIKSLSLGNKDARKLSRYLLSGASEELPDKSGRVVLPNHLRDYAGLEKEVVIIGVSNRLEVWSRSNWSKYSAEAEQSYEDNAEEMADIGF